MTSSRAHVVSISQPDARSVVLWYLANAIEILSADCFRQRMTGENAARCARFLEAAGSSAGKAVEYLRAGRVPAKEAAGWRKLRHLDHRGSGMIDYNWSAPKPKRSSVIEVRWTDSGWQAIVQGSRSSHSSGRRTAR